MQTNDHRHRFETIVQKIRESNHKLTPQRLAVAKILARSEGHPSVETIYERLKGDFPTMSLATVYKTINLLKKEGEVLELEFSDLSNRYDGRKPFPHPHVICTGCGKILDPSHLDLEEITRDMMRETGFKILTHRLDFYGLCPECQ